jgi:hypothetical protein
MLVSRVAPKGNHLVSRFRFNKLTSTEELSPSYRTRMNIRASIRPEHQDSPWIARGAASDPRLAQIAAKLHDLMQNARRSSRA